jgi:hypothetical protein
MPGGGFTGNNSVDWFIEGNDNREVKISHSRPGSEGKPRRYRHEGTEETSAGQHFVIKIHYPRNADANKAFREALAAAATGSGRAATLRIPVEDVQSGYSPMIKPAYQITVEWET